MELIAIPLASRTNGDGTAPCCSSSVDTHTHTPSEKDQSDNVSIFLSWDVCKKWGWHGDRYGWKKAGIWHPQNVDVQGKNMHDYKG